MIMHRWQLWLLGWSVAALVQLVLYLRQRRTRNATAVDAGWAGSLALCACLYALLGPGDTSHRLLIAAVAGIENLRLASLLRNRIGKVEDSRYRDLRARWQARGREQSSFAGFYQAQALLAAVLSLPFLFVCFNRQPGLAPLELAGAAMWLAAVAFEATADHQLASFRTDPANKGKTLRAGLWRYSRHPNYFFQTLTWLAYALIAAAAPWGWLAFLAPALILYLVVFVTGIPPAEQASLRSRGDDYRRYQQETSIFVPWFPKSSTD